VLLMSGFLTPCPQCGGQFVAREAPGGICMTCRADPPQVLSNADAVGLCALRGGIWAAVTTDWTGAVVALPAGMWAVA
jgi:hypothetical protein